MKTAFLVALLCSPTAFAAGCGPETLDWPSADGKNICGAQSDAGVEGETISLGSMTLLETGSAEFRCENGHWIFVSGTCVASAPF